MMENRSVNAKLTIVSSTDQNSKLSAPLQLVADLTTRCNLRCAYCCFFNRPEESGCGDLSVENWTKLFDEAGRMGVCSVVLRGGEALLSPAFDAVLAAIVRNRMRFSLLSNGLEFSDRVAEKLAATGRCNLIKISLDGREKSHDPWRGAGSHRRALAGIDAARRVGLPLKVTCAVHKRNFREIPDIVTYFANDLKLPSFSFSAVTVAADMTLALSADEFGEAMHLLRLSEVPAMSRSGMYGVLARWRGMLNGRRGCMECDRMRTTLAVLADGSFVPCSVLSHVPVGKFGTDSLSGAWRKLAEHDGLRRRTLPDAECSGCRFAGVCNGICAGIKLNPVPGLWRYECLRRHVERYGSGL